MSERVWTAAEFKSMTDRPRRINESSRFLFAPAVRRHNVTGEPAYAFVSPCCGKTTLIEIAYVALAGRSGSRLWFECGKGYTYTRGNPRNGGCRACYHVTPQPDAGGDAVFELRWRGH